MDKPTDDIIEKVLNNHGEPKDVKWVIEWFATDDGQKYLSEYIDKNDSINIEVKAEDSTEIHIWENIQEKIYTPFYRKKQLLKYAAVFIPFIIATALFFYQSREDKSLAKAESIAVYVPKGEHRHVILQDGTSIYLGPNSSLRYPQQFSSDERKISFTGEAYFDVARNPQKPFLISLGEVELKVLGTSFNVMASPVAKEIKVNLDKGKVNVRSASSKSVVPIVAGDYIVYSKRTKIIKKNIEGNDGSYYVNWKNNTIIFNNTDLPTVLKVLSSKFNIDFKIKNPSVSNFTYTIRLEKKSLNTILSDLESITPIGFHNRGEYIEVCKK